MQVSAFGTGQCLLSPPVLPEAETIRKLAVRECGTAGFCLFAYHMFFQVTPN